MNLVDLKYCGILSTRLDRYKVKQTNPYKANFRCPICGDSQKSKSLCRGWLIEKEQTAMFHCFNCGQSHPLWRFLKVTDVGLYNDYVIDSKFDKMSTRPMQEKPRGLETLTTPVPNFKRVGSPLLKIKKMGQLPADHPARAYVNNRKIPTKAHHRLYYAPKFNTWVNSLIPDKLPQPERDKPRLILPLIDQNGVVFGFQGRAFDKDSLRYITIMLDEDRPKLFGLDQVDFEKKYYVVEGPIDSLFLSNALAMAGADGNASGLQNLPNAVFVFDNEPRNKEIINRMERMIDRGYKVCIWPSKIDVKDINDMVLSGFSTASVELMIDQNTYDGLRGRLALAEWRKC
jgi:transcription elongation factor Elf1